MRVAPVVVNCTLAPAPTFTFSARWSPPSNPPETLCRWARAAPSCTANARTTFRGGSWWLAASTVWPANSSRAKSSVRDACSRGGAQSSGLISRAFCATEAMVFADAFNEQRLTDKESRAERGMFHRAPIEQRHEAARIAERAGGAVICRSDYSRLQIPQNPGG